MTVGLPLSYGDGWILVARNDRPRKHTPRVTPMITRVLRACFHSGLWKALTPLEMASTPVTAVPAEAKALSTTHTPAP